MNKFQQKQEFTVQKHYFNNISFSSRLLREYINKFGEAVSFQPHLFGGLTVYIKTKKPAQLLLL
jgi:hypothetical protein